MNKQELIEKLAEKSHMSKSDAKKTLDALLETISESLAKGDSVQLVGFGTFKISERKARTGRNPRTGEQVKIAAKKIPTFSPGAAFKNAVNA
ncbi:MULTISPECIES: HU family DNA-binding protein [Ruminobacter]|uniref:HU family DNA-binding protein n=1 Tax=Ruminobacter TaxID=866 RepID=UPI00386EA9A2